MRADRRATLLIVASRALSEAVALACLAALLHAMTLGREPIPLLATTLMVLGLTLVLVSILRERGTVKQGATLVAVVMIGWALWGMSQPARNPDSIAVLTRLIGSAILGEVWLWRSLGIARGLHRWREVRNDALFALAAVVIAALVAGPIDRNALPALGLAVACCGAVALSLARSAEELSLSTGQAQGRPSGSSATGTAFALGGLAIGVAFGLPSLEAFVAAAARVMGPIVGQAIFLILLPLGYLAAYLVNVVYWIRAQLRISPRPTETPDPVNFGADAERMRELEELRPFVFGAVELMIAAVALIAALLLIVRLITERRSVLTEGVSLDREAVDGIGLGATLRGLLRQRAAPLRAPADDGTPAGALRRLYWRLLEIAEREGPGWRAPAETPAEHEARLARSAARWRDAAPVVRAFEALRYGEVDPDRATVDSAREALQRVEATR